MNCVCAKYIHADQIEFDQYQINDEYLGYAWSPVWQSVIAIRTREKLIRLLAKKRRKIGNIHLRFIQSQSGHSN